MVTWREAHDEACGPCKDAKAYGKELVVRALRDLAVGDVVFFSPSGRVEVTRAHPHHCTGEVVRVERVKRHNEVTIRWGDCQRCEDQGQPREVTWTRGGSPVLVLDRGV